MAPTPIQQRRSHNLLLINKLLSQRDASPFTLILDSLEQSGTPLVSEFVRRAQAANIKVVFVSYEHIVNNHHADAFVRTFSPNHESVMKAEVTAAIKSFQSDGHRSLVVFDTLDALAATEHWNVAGTLQSFISPTVSLLATYHQDIPRPASNTWGDPYAPAPLTLLRYMATTIFTTHSLHHVVAAKAARERSHAEPSFGLDEGREGVVQGFGSNGKTGLVLEMEHRRKSGRGVREWYFLPARTQGTVGVTPTLLEDHPLYHSPEKDAAATGEADDLGTFELGLTNKQRKDREGVVLPYFDAQTGSGDGGRILYDMGSEDDFDEEEDEI